MNQPDPMALFSDEQRMTKAERLELARVVRMRARLAKTEVTTRQAELMARFEEEVAAEYKINDDRWREIVATAKRMVHEIDEQVAEICKAAGIRPEFRPGIDIYWHYRGENASEKRRAELRKVATTRLAAEAKRAFHEIDKAEVSLCTDLTERSLTTAEAKDWLERLPSVEVLLPPMSVAEIERDAGPWRS